MNIVLKKAVLVAVVTLCINYLFVAQNIRISQIDNTAMLYNQKVKLYLSITDKDGTPIKNVSGDQLSVFESADGKDFMEITKPVSVKEGINNNTGVNFLLLVDNSGSMYFDMFGRKTDKVEKQRMTLAKNAIKSFLNDITNVNDKIGLAVYNSYYTGYTTPTKDKSLIYGSLDDISRPENDEGWSEIYGSLYLAIEEFSRIRGRKALVILSDGRNLSFFENVKKAHRDFGTKVFKFDEPVQYAQEEGISIYAINFGKDKDLKLKDIARDTGGAVFDAYNESDLKKIYKNINEQIAAEYLLTYPATTNPAIKKYVKVKLNLNNKPYEVTRFYFASSLFGIPLDNFSLLLFIILILAIVLLWILSLLKFQNRLQGAGLEVLASATGKASTKMLTLNKGTTVIGSSQNANMTILGVPDVKENHAEIVYDQKSNGYTIISPEFIKVNNKKVKTKALEPGDVVNVGGTLIVFDENDYDKK